MKRKILLLIFVSVSLICKHSISQVTSDMDKSVDFSVFKTYNILPVQCDSAIQINDLEKSRLENDLKAEMDNRGFTYKDISNPDIMMSIYVLLQNEQSISSYTDYMGGYGYGMGMGIGMMGPDMGMANTTVSEDDYQEGTTTIGCFDASTKKLIWEGVYKGEVKNKNKDKVASSKMHSVMKKFPVKELKKK